MLQQRIKHNAEIMQLVVQTNTIMKYCHVVHTYTSLDGCSVLNAIIVIFNHSRNMNKIHNRCVLTRARFNARV